MKTYIIGISRWQGMLTSTSWNKSGLSEGTFSVPFFTLCHIYKFWLLSHTIDSYYHNCQKWSLSSPCHWGNSKNPLKIINKYYHIIIMINKYDHSNHLSVGAITIIILWLSLSVLFIPLSLWLTNMIIVITLPLGQ